MWYFVWMLGLGFAVAVAIIAAIYLETNYAFGHRDEATTLRRLERFRRGDESRVVPSSNREGQA